jgi:hypothetical protein
MGDELYAKCARTRTENDYDDRRIAMKFIVLGGKEVDVDGISCSGVPYDPNWQPTHYHSCRLQIKDGQVVAVCDSCGEVFDRNDIENEMNRSLSDY